MGQAMLSDEMKTKWQEALMLPGHTDLTKSNMSELAAYFGISEEEAEANCKIAEKESKREWEVKPRTTDNDIVNFYDVTRSYIFEHMWWHAVNPESSANVAILNYAMGHNAHSYLDFGSGVGANGILYAMHGFEVTLADVSRTMLDFAKWRLERRGLKATYIYLRQEELPQDQFDLATAFDVLEHVVHPSRELKRLAAALHRGGTLVFNCLTGVDENKPMHIVHSSYDVYRGVRAAGFRRDDSIEAQTLTPLGLDVMRRGTQSHIDDVICGLYDRYKYSRVADAYWGVKQGLLQKLVKTG